MQPRSLFEQASCVLGTVIGKQALLFIENMNLMVENAVNEENKDLELSIKKCAEFYDDKIPYSLHNIVTHHTLLFMSLKTFKIPQNDLNIFNFILRCHATKIDFCGNEHLPPFDVRHMIHKNLPKLKNLKYLSFNLRHMKDENLNYVLKGIESMKQLETFKCSDCSDNVIKVLCDNCPLINLNLQNNNCVTDLSVQPILKLKNLRMLNIKFTRISREGQTQIVLGLPHLTDVLGFKPISLLPEIGEGNVTSVQRVECMYFKECDVINLTKFCPFIKQLNLIIMNMFDLSSIANLEWLTSLDIHLASFIAVSDFYKCNIPTILEARGYQITELKLFLVNNISVATLNIIDVSCPNLKTFSLPCCLSDDVADFPTNKLFFQNLEHFSNELITSPTDPTSCLIFFLRNCVKIKEVHFGFARNFCDDDLDAIISCNPLKSLEEFIILFGIKLTVVYKLLTSCKQLRRLGEIRTTEVTRSELKELQNYVRKNNLDVKFVEGW